MIRQNLSFSRCVIYIQKQFDETSDRFENRKTEKNYHWIVTIWWYDDQIWLLLASCCAEFWQVRHQLLGAFKYPTSNCSFPKAFEILSSYHRANWFLISFTTWQGINFWLVVGFNSPEIKFLKKVIYWPLLLTTSYRLIIVVSTGIKNQLSIHLQRIMIREQVIDKSSKIMTTISVEGCRKFWINIEFWIFLKVFLSFFKLF